MEANKKELVRQSEKMITHQINLLGDKDEEITVIDKELIIKFIN